MKNLIKQAKSALIDYVVFMSLVHMGMSIDGKAQRRARRKEK